MNIRSLKCVVVLLLCFFVFGCEKADPRKKDMAPVSGKVTYKGQAVDGAVIIFHSKDAVKQGGGAISKADGSFALTTFGDEDGTYPGNYVVTVVKDTMTYPVSEEKIAELEAAGEEIPAGKIEKHLPEKYRLKTTSDLTVEVPSQGLKDFVLELTD